MLTHEGSVVDEAYLAGFSGNIFRIEGVLASNFKGVEKAPKKSSIVEVKSDSIDAALKDALCDEDVQDQIVKALLPYVANSSSSQKLQSELESRQSEILQLKEQLRKGADLVGDLRKALEKSESKAVEDRDVFLQSQESLRQENEKLKKKLEEEAKQKDELLEKVKLFEEEKKKFAAFEEKLKSIEEEKNKFATDAKAFEEKIKVNEEEKDKLCAIAKALEEKIVKIEEEKKKIAEEQAKVIADHADNRDKNQGYVFEFFQSICKLRFAKGK